MKTREEFVEASSRYIAKVRWGMVVLVVAVVGCGFVKGFLEKTSAPDYVFQILQVIFIVMLVIGSLPFVLEGRVKKSLGLVCEGCGQILPRTAKLSRVIAENRCPHCGQPLYQ